MGLNLNLSLKFHSSLLVRRKLFFCFKLWATTPNNMQQGVKMDAACPSKNLGVVSWNMALKQQRRWLLKSILKRQLKSVFAQVQTSSRLFHLVQFVKLGEFVWSWILKSCIKVQEKQKRGRFLVFTSCTKREIIILKQFHVVVVKRRQGNVRKKRDASAKMLFCLLNLWFFKTFSLPSRRWILGPVYKEVHGGPQVGEVKM